MAFKVYWRDNFDRIAKAILCFITLIAMACTAFLNGWIGAYVKLENKVFEFIAMAIFFASPFVYFFGGLFLVDKLRAKYNW